MRKHCFHIRLILSFLMVMFGLFAYGQSNDKQESGDEENRGAVSITANPTSICVGGTAQLHAEAVTSMVVDFETGDFSQAIFANNNAYPWEITTANPYEGTYCMKSSNEDVHSSDSYIETVVEVPCESVVSFYVKVSSEYNYDKFHFYIDGVEYGQPLSGNVSYTYMRFRVVEGTHTYRWSYTKDYNYNSSDDCAYVDNIILCQPMDFVSLVNVDFETGNFSQADFTNTGQYPWSVVAGGNGSSYCMSSTNQGETYSSSIISLSFSSNNPSYVSFDAKFMGETGTYIYDKCIFYIDNVPQFTYGQVDFSWHFYQSNSIPAGTHTLKWEYSKDGSVDPAGDAFLVDNIAIYLDNPTGSGGSVNATFHWEPGNQNTQDITVSPSETTTYTVTAYQSGVLIGSAHQTIVVYSDPDLNITTSTGETEICEGDTITIYANVAPVNDILVGDIYCTDGSFVHCDAWSPNNGKTAKGIVFYVDLTGEHGWVVGLDQSSAMWCNNITSSVPGLATYSHWMDAISDLDGYTNTRIIREIGNNTVYPAAWAVDFENGWYLPAIGQLNVLLGSIFVINNSLDKVGGTPIGYTSNQEALWSSSTSTTPKFSLLFVTRYEQVKFEAKNKEYLIREVINF